MIVLPHEAEDDLCPADRGELPRRNELERPAIDRVPDVALLACNIPKASNSSRFFSINWRMFVGRFMPSRAATSRSRARGSPSISVRVIMSMVRPSLHSRDFADRGAPHRRGLLDMLLRDAELFDSGDGEVGFAGLVLPDGDVGTAVPHGLNGAFHQNLVKFVGDQIEVSVGQKKRVCGYLSQNCHRARDHLRPDRGCGLLFRNRAAQKLRDGFLDAICMGHTTADRFAGKIAGQLLDQIGVGGGQFKFELERRLSP